MGDSWAARFFLSYSLLKRVVRIESLVSRVVGCFLLLLFDSFFFSFFKVFLFIYIFHAVMLDQNEKDIYATF